MRIHATLPGPDLKNKKKSLNYKNFIAIKNSMGLLPTTYLGCIDFTSISPCGSLVIMVIKEF